MEVERSPLVYAEVFKIENDKRNMSTLFKRLASTVSLLGFSVAIALPSVAQSNFTPGPSSPNTNQAAPSDRDTGVPSINNSPNQTSPNQTSPDQSVPGTVNPANRPVAPGQPFSATPNSGDQTIDAIVRTNPSFELFNALLGVANSQGILTNQLSGDSNYTVFAPTDAALAQIPPATFKALVQPENRDLLARVLENHIVKGKVSSADLTSQQVRSMGGNAMAAQGGSGTLTIGNARVIGPDIQASNGIIHAVDNVILPADLQAQLSGLSAQPSTPNQGVR
jgi:uncharacterized surface protein with fasciclin (FAS1) repeats